MSQTERFDIEAIHPQIPTSFDTDAGTAIPIANTLEIIGGEGIDTSGAGKTVTVSAEIATSGATALLANKGVASFSSADFTVTGGFVEIAAAFGGISSVTTDSGAPAVVPDATGMANILGGEGINVTGQGPGNTITIAGEDASQVNKGITRYATNAEALAAVSTETAVTPSNLGYALPIVFASPGPIGSTTPSTGAFTTLSATLTSHGILMGNGTGAIQATAEPSDGQLLIGDTGGFPILGTLTAGTGIGIANAAGSITVGMSTALTNGQLWIGSTGAVPVAAGITAGAGISVAIAAGTITISAAGGGTSWAVTTVDAALVVNNGYIANKAGLLTMTLPATAAIGDTIRITGMNTAIGWRIAQNALQRIRFGLQSTTVGIGGYVEATQIRDTAELVCVVAGGSTEYNIISSIGNLTVA
jgi:hypothetical protein